MQDYLNLDFFEVKESILFQKFGWLRETKRLMIESRFGGDYDVARALLESYLVDKYGMLSVPKFHGRVLRSMKCCDDNGIQDSSESLPVPLPEKYYHSNEIPKDYYLNRMINYYLMTRDDREIEEYIKSGWQQ